MQEWLFEWIVRFFDVDTASKALAELEFPTQKPPAHLTIDDRGFRFDGLFPTLQYMSAFKPWNKR
jgi:hypothetical protein